MSAEPGDGESRLTQQLLATGSVLLYLIAYLLTGAGAAAPVLFGVLGAMSGLGALWFDDSRSRIVVGVVLQAVMVTYPVTYVSTGVFSNDVATGHFVAAMLCAGAFVVLVLRSPARGGSS